MQFSEYEKQAVETAKYPNVGRNFVYPTLGLVGEAGEVAEKIKKILRDESGVVSDEKKEEIKKEMGDVLWYLATLSREFGFTLEDIAKKNIEKLASRRERGVLHGSGDNR
ncbi:MAG: nucleoside triphosphate pyrophosphohydrolase family protein [Patescibacteria group bacterium]